MTTTWRDVERLRRQLTTRNNLERRLRKAEQQLGILTPSTRTLEQRLVAVEEYIRTSIPGGKLTEDKPSPRTKAGENEQA
jgi:hypothetical protein